MMDNRENEVKGQKVLTKEVILKNYHYVRTILLFSIFFVAGVLVFLSPFAYWGGSVSKLLINMGVILFIAVPFCYFIAYRNISFILHNVSSIKRDDFFIEEDVVTNKWVRNRNNSSIVCQIEFKNYDKRSGEVFWVENSEYNRVKEGDKYYMVYLLKKDGKEEFFARFSLKEYTLDESLKSFIKEELE